jgi:hypothetical protein
VPIVKKVFDMGPLKRDFLRRAKMMEVGGGDWRGEGNVEALGETVAGVEKLL